MAGGSAPPSPLRPSKSEAKAAAEERMAVEHCLYHAAPLVGDGLLTIGHGGGHSSKVPAGEGPMLREAGEEDGPTVTASSAKRKAEVAPPATGEKGPLEGCAATRRKAEEAAARSTEKPADAVAVAVAELAPGEFLWVPVRHGGDCSSVVEPVRGADGAPLVWRGGATRLPAGEVDAILSLNVPDPEADYDNPTLRRLLAPEALEESRKVNREAAEVVAEVKRDFVAFQGWVNREMEEKGYVEVPEKFIQDREEFMEWAQQEIDQMFAGIQVIPDRYLATTYA